MLEIEHVRVNTQIYKLDYIAVTAPMNLGNKQMRANRNTGKKKGVSKSQGLRR